MGLVLHRSGFKSTSGAVTSSAYSAEPPGFLYFSENVPVPNARKFNFTVDAGAGITVMARFAVGLLLGYKFHHLSNASTAKTNPGLNANLFYVGFTRRGAAPACAGRLCPRTPSYEVPQQER
ncbi:MAG: acyloxyacyl hydrolase [Gemmatimonadetes bacterium]|nr:acyloxyacyl hydrolase [Gemmatimonadota bacterium]